ncbi:MAG TPA: hypothetical protein ENG39_02200, partial [Candidatus Omnitrophica bacterium]|nr:hypothetical protein [Candidatus Omnitrophota bacterium]
MRQINLSNRQKKSRAPHKIILEMKTNPDSAYALEADFKYEAFKILEVASHLNEFRKDEYKRFVNEHRIE